MLQRAILAQNVAGLRRPDRRAAHVPGQQLNATVTAQSLLQTPEQFAGILLKSQPDGVGGAARGRGARRAGRRELRSVISRFNGQPGRRHRHQAGARAPTPWTRPTRSRRRRPNCPPAFPPGIELGFPVDNTPFVKLSIQRGDQDPDRGDRAW